MHVSWHPPEIALDFFLLDNSLDLVDCRCARSLKKQPRGPQPFRITSITGTDESVTATAEDAAKPVHIIVVGVKPASPGDFARTLKIATDLSADAAAELPVTASVAMPHVE